VLPAAPAGDGDAACRRWRVVPAATSTSISSSRLDVIAAAGTGGWDPPFTGAVEAATYRGDRATPTLADISLRAIPAIFYASRYTTAVHHVAQNDARKLLAIGAAYDRRVLACFDP
jgi:hypothetical protein